MYGWFSRSVELQRAERPGKINRPTIKGVVGEGIVMAYPCIYSTPDGRRVKITEVTHGGEKPYMEDDLVFVGEVVDCLRTSTGRWLVIDGVRQGPVPEDPV